MIKVIEIIKVVLGGIICINKKGGESREIIVILVVIISNIDMMVVYSGKLVNFIY